VTRRVVLFVGLVGGCGTAAAPDRPPPVPLHAGPATGPIVPAPTPPPVAEGPRKLSLDDPEALVPVTGSDLNVQLLGGWHKASAPLSGVDVRFARGEYLAEVGWRIESGAIDPDWQDISGQRYDDATDRYVDTAIAGWQVRLLSVDDTNAGGSPTAITIEVRRAP